MGEVSIEDAADQLRALGVRPGGVLLVHASYRAVRPIAGGPAGVVRALIEALGPEGTLVMPTWPKGSGADFDPLTTPAARDLGIVAETFRAWPGARRTDHLMAFSARGPQAEAILADPLPLPPHRLESPVGRVWELGGQILLLGVDHDADTTIHLAEVMAEVPYGVTKRCEIRTPEGPKTVEYREKDHCCSRFKLVGPWLAATGRQRSGPAGHGTAHLVDARDLVEEVVRRLRSAPLLFLHPKGTGCEECDEAHESIGAG